MVEDIKNKEGKVIAQLASREEHLWMKNKEHAQNTIKSAEEQIIVNKAFVQMCDRELLKLRRNHKPKGAQSGK